MYQPNNGTGQDRGHVAETNVQTTRFFFFTGKFRDCREYIAFAKVFEHYWYLWNSSCRCGTQAMFQTHKSVNECRIEMFRPIEMDPRIKGVIRRPRIVSITWYTMPIHLNEANIGRSVHLRFRKSTYGSLLAKTSETILETATLQGLTRSLCLP